MNFFNQTFSQNFSNEIEHKREVFMLFLTAVIFCIKKTKWSADEQAEFQVKAFESYLRKKRFQGEDPGQEESEEGSISSKSNIGSLMSMAIFVRMRRNE